MENDDEDPIEEDVLKLARGSVHSKFPNTGAFAKSCWALGSVVLSLAAIAYASGTNPWVCGSCVLAATGVALYVFHRLFNFIEKNPAAAILEGAEFSRHEQFMMASKNIPRIPNDEPAQEPEGLLSAPRSEVTVNTEDPRVESEANDA